MREVNLGSTGCRLDFRQGNSDCPATQGRKLELLVVAVPVMWVRTTIIDAHEHPQRLCARVTQVDDQSGVEAPVWPDLFQRYAGPVARIGLHPYAAASDGDNV